MEKGKIVSVRNYDTLHRYIIKKQQNIHGLFCNLFHDLGLSDDAVGEVDIIFDDLDNDYIYIDEANRSVEIHFFVTKDIINFIIKTEMNQEELNRKIAKYFTFEG